MIETDDIIAHIDKEIQEEFEKENEILLLLNKFGKISLKKKYIPLEICEKDKLILFELIKSKFNSLKKTLEEKYKFTKSHLATLAFKALFIGEDNFRIDINFKTKILCFESILRAIKKKFKKKSNTLDQMNLTNFRELYNWPIFGFQNQFPAYVALITLNYSNSVEEFFELALLCLEISYEFDCDIIISNLKGIDKSEVVKDLSIIFNNGSTKLPNYFYLTLKKNHIVKENKSIDELEKYIKENDEEEDEEEVGDEDEDEDEDEEDKKKNNNTKTQEKKNKIEVKMEEKANDSMQDKMQINDKVKKTIEQKSNIPAIKSNKKMEKLNNDSNYVSKKEFDEEKEKMKSELIFLKQKREQLENKINDLEISIIKINGNLKLIQSRDALKAFLDYCLIGLKINEKFYNYEEKTKAILRKIDLFQKEPIYDSKILNNFLEIFKNIYIMIKKGNKLAHKVNLDESIIQQIIDITIKKDEILSYAGFKNKFNEINTDTILKSMIENRDKNFFDTDTFNKKQEKIFERIQNIEKILLNKK